MLNTRTVMRFLLVLAAWLVGAVLLAVCGALALMGAGYSVVWAGAGGVVLGALALAPLARTLNILANALARGKPATSRWHGPLSGLVAQVNALLEQREGVLDRTRALAAQQERARLARDLHDSIKQEVFAIGMSAAAAQARLERDPEGARQALEDVRRSAHEATVEMNALLQQLAPAPLEKIGLMEALREQGQALSYRSGAQVVVECGDLPSNERIAAGTQEALFRIAQEALSNIARHARATQVHVRLAQAGERLCVEIRDDGQGFAPESGQGMGLVNMRLRAQALGGKLEVDSAPGHGTRVVATIPLLEESDFQEETMKPSYTLTKIVVTGVLGGVVIAALLNYPLAVALPGSFVPDWAPATNWLAFLLLGLSVPARVALGWVAARWTASRGTVGARHTGALAGALAGGLAGVITFGLVGAPAAVVTGNASIFAHGLTPAASDAQFQTLIVESIIGIIGWTQATFWLFMLGGAGLGAFGGWFALRPTGAMPSTSDDRRVVASTVLFSGLLAGAMATTICMMVFGILEASARRSLLNAGVDTTSYEAGLAGISLWLILTPLALYTAFFAGLLVFLRLERADGAGKRLGGSVATGWIAVLCAAILQVTLLSYLLPANENAPTLKIVLWVYTLAHIGLIVLCVRVTWQVRARYHALGLHTVKWSRGQALALARDSVDCAVGASCVMLLPLIPGVSAGIGTVLLTVTSIVSLTPDSTSAPMQTLMQLTQDLYATHLVTWGGIGVVYVVGLGLMILLLSAITAMRVRAQAA